MSVAGNSIADHRGYRVDSAKRYSYASLSWCKPDQAEMLCCLLLGVTRYVFAAMSFDHKRDAKAKTSLTFFGNGYHIKVRFPDCNATESKAISNCLAS